MRAHKHLYENLFSCKDCSDYAIFVATSRIREVATMSSSVQVREWSNLRIVFGTFIGSSSGYRFYTISDSTKRYYVDDSRGQYRYHPILCRPLSSTIDYLSTETFQFMWSQQCGFTGKRISLQCSAILLQ